MPTALTTATGREDLLEITISMAAQVRANSNTDTVCQRLATLVARYLNTMRLHEESGEAEHDDLDAAAVALLDQAIVVGLLTLDAGARRDGRLQAAIRQAAPLAHLYLLAANRKHNPGRAMPPEPPPAQPPPAPRIPTPTEVAERRAYEEYLRRLRDSYLRDGAVGRMTRR